MARAVVPLNFNAFLEKAKLKDDDGHIMSHILITCDVYPFMHLILLRASVAL